MNSGRKGFTLIELVMTIVISGIALYSLLLIFLSATAGSVNQEALSAAVCLAESKAEELSNLDFVSLSSGPLTGLGSEFAHFAGYVTVSYVNSDALDTPVVGPTSYKKIIVGVTSPALGIGTVEVPALVTDASN